MIQSSQVLSQVDEQLDCTTQYSLNTLTSVLYFTQHWESVQFSQASQHVKKFTRFRICVSQHVQDTQMIAGKSNS